MLTKEVVFRGSLILTDDCLFQCLFQIQKCRLEKTPVESSVPAAVRETLLRVSVSHIGGAKQCASSAVTAIIIPSTQTHQFLPPALLQLQLWCED